jgi:predicted RNA-binding Zn-ribbon protein involved in translation (DUF1610 family)
MADEDYEPDEPDESDVCPHGKGFDTYCELCDEDDEEDEEIPVCPECGSDDLTIIGEDDDGNNEYECEDCGERFSDGEEDA